jgi:phosphatidylserine/phosphatidylglycerophosphate/cardiolipin synthase-like enzyme
LLAIVLSTAALLASGAGPEVAFSPSGGAEALIVRTILSAKKTVRVAAYVLTSDSIGSALRQAHQHGVDVRVVVDERAFARGPYVIRILALNGVPVRADSRYAVMHDKFIVVDESTVEEGSFNYTSAAEHRNAENVVILHDRQLAKRYNEEWERLWQESVRIDP